MLAEDKLREGQVEEALALLQDRVRKAPNDAKCRIFLFQLLSVLGRWERALTQLKVVGDLDPSCLPMVQTYRELLRCEVLRAQVFAGQRTPVLFGEPKHWAALMVEALRLTAEDKHVEAQLLRDQALEAAPPTAGTINGTRFDWIADGDTRLGPVLEAIVYGRYFWIPFDQLRALRVDVPQDLRDMVWTPVVLTLATGAETVAFVPTRYPGSESHANGAVSLARRTDWTEIPGGFLGIGQRVLATNEGDHALLDVREIELDAADEAAEAKEAALDDG